MAQNYRVYEMTIHDRTLIRVYSKHDLEKAKRYADKCQIQMNKGLTIVWYQIEDVISGKRNFYFNRPVYRTYWTPDTNAVIYEDIPL